MDILTEKELLNKLLVALLIILRIHRNAVHQRDQFNKQNNRKKEECLCENIVLHKQATRVRKIYVILY